MIVVNDVEESDDVMKLLLIDLGRFDMFEVGEQVDQEFVELVRVKYMGKEDELFVFDFVFFWWSLVVDGFMIIIVVFVIECWYIYFGR